MARPEYRPARFKPRRQGEEPRFTEATFGPSDFDEKETPTWAALTERERIDAALRTGRIKATPWEPEQQEGRFRRIWRWITGR